MRGIRKGVANADVHAATCVVCASVGRHCAYFAIVYGMQGEKKRTQKKGKKLRLPLFTR